MYLISKNKTVVSFGDKYSDEDKLRVLNGVLTVLNVIVNKRLDVTIQKVKTY